MRYSDQLNTALNWLYCTIWGLGVGPYLQCGLLSRAPFKITFSSTPEGPWFHNSYWIDLGLLIRMVVSVGGRQVFVVLSRGPKR